jgi:dephospho-CoA kinase
MLIVGLTGSLGMGKSTAAAYLRERGVPVFDADAEVHRLYESAAVAPIEAAFPGATVDGRVDRARLSAMLLAAPHRFVELEAIVHPLVRAAERAFLKREAARGTKIAVVEIPLLFETGAEKLVDATIVVSATPELQRQRLTKRENLSLEKLERLLSRQLPDVDKRGRADFVVDTSGDLSASRAQIDVILAQLKEREGEAFARHWA